MLNMFVSTALAAFPYTLQSTLFFAFFNRISICMKSLTLFCLIKNNNFQKVLKG